MDKSHLHIQTINYEAEQFRTAFSRFRNSLHAIDESLCIKLYQIVSEIDNFLDSKPMEIELPRKELITSANVKKSGIRKTFVCKKCDDRDIGSTFVDVSNHIKQFKHDNLKRTHKKESPANISRKAKLENKILPKKVKAMIHGDIQSFFNENLEVAKKLVHSPDYIEIENELLKLIRPAFPDQTVKINFFGSRLSGIGTLHSDLDIFIDIGGVFNTFENRPSAETKKKLQTVQGILSKNSQWSQLIAIQNARVPILKILYKPKFLNCDIGFSNSLGYCNTNLTKYLLELQPIAKRLAFFLKKWIERSKLNEHITTYSAVLLVIFYLQTKNLLPSIKALQDGLEDDQAEIGPWLAVFAEKSLQDLNISHAPYAVENFKNEMKSFFKFYSTFDFKHKLICPYLGQTISVKDLETSPLLPRYVKYIETEKDNKDALLNIQHMNVQDPFQLNHNVTKAVPSTVVLLLKQYFELSLNAMEDGESSQIINKDESIKK
ncbi:terminal uridylyltransferase Tailor [Episyrphus balteatus]|uniref:terminal uridylyltransferase Tailor n=1 Tax=Episyrphus balteatus TaxID=286459 RepID=UPI002485B36C|nr:terminal uridylyltransferase Tailor [Episyrphus balteatus]